MEWFPFHQNTVPYLPAAKDDSSSNLRRIHITMAFRWMEKEKIHNKLSISRSFQVEIMYVSSSSVPSGMNANIFDERPQDPISALQRQSNYVWICV